MWLLGFAILLGLVALDAWLLDALFGVSYLDAALQNGFIVTGLTSAVFALIDRDENIDLLSAHPFHYVGTAAAFAVGPLIFATGTALRTDDPRARSRLDAWLSVPVTLLLVAAALLWLVLVMPLQYFVNLVCGAPVRLSAASERRTVGSWEDGVFKVEEASRVEPLPGGAVDLSLDQKPVTVTNAIASIVLFGLSLVT
jgi:hypothetical protein